MNESFRSCPRKCPTDLLALCFAMAVAIVMGMGIPTTASYVLSPSVAVPSLTTLGIPPLSAHMFVFYFAILSAITPPVCPAVYVSSAIARSHWWPTALIAYRLGLAGFIIPYMFYYAPSLLFEGSFFQILLNSATAFAGIVSLSAGIMGFFQRELSWHQQVIPIACGSLLIDPKLSTDILAFIPLSCLYLSQRYQFSMRQILARLGLRPGQGL